MNLKYSFEAYCKESEEILIYRDGDMLVFEQEGTFIFFGLEEGQNLAKAIASLVKDTIYEKGEK